MEAALLRELNWEVVMLTPSHFVDAFLGISGGATFPSDTIGGQPWAEVAAEYLEKYTIFFSVQPIPSLFCMQIYTLRFFHR